MQRWLRISAAALATVGCADSAGPEFTTITPPVTTPPEQRELVGSPLHDRWGPCPGALESECLEDEQCIFSTSEAFSICLAACDSVDGCVAPSAPVTPEVAQRVTCSEFEGTKRCILSCQSESDCQPGMACALGACVWR